MVAAPHPADASCQRRLRRAGPSRGAEGERGRGRPVERPSQKEAFHYWYARRRLQKCLEAGKMSVDSALTVRGYFTTQSRL